MQLDTITTFLSWQSDILGQTRFIRQSLSEVVPLLEKEIINLSIVNDEATRNTPGSPSIILTILNKINKSDIFIADVTLINGEQAGIESTEQIKLAPNPNVMFELGYAVALLGWDRIILLNNNKVSATNDLPFDIKHNRVLEFSAQEFNDSEKGHLRSKLKEAVKLIISSNPNRNVVKILKTDDEIKHERDVRKLRQLLKELDFDSILASLDLMPFRIEDRLAHYFEFSKMCFPYCDLYNEELESKFKELFSTYSLLSPTIANYDFNNHTNPNLRFYSLNQKDHSKEFFIEYQHNLIKLESIIKDIKEIVRNEYIEIDLDETNQYARQQYTKLFCNPLDY